VKACNELEDQHTMMQSLMTPFYGRKRFLQRQRPVCIWTLARRYQLVELLGLMGAIALVWLGTQLDNRLAEAPPPEVSTVTSTSADLTIGVPVGQHRSP
jgi:hypothetical protein